MEKKSGITLVEMLIVFFLIALIGVTAVTTYRSSTRTFGFLSAYRDIISPVKKARAYALTNYKATGGENDRFGVMIDEKIIKLFADDGPNPYIFDDPGDTILEDLDYTEEDYSLELQFPAGDFEFPAYLYYENSTGEVRAFASKTGFPGPQLIDKKSNKFLSFIFTDEEHTRYVYVFLLSGILEGFEQSLL